MHVGALGPSAAVRATETRVEQAARGKLRRRGFGRASAVVVCTGSEVGGQGAHAVAGATQVPRRVAAIGRFRFGTPSGRGSLGGQDGRSDSRASVGTGGGCRRGAPPARKRHVDSAPHGSTTPRRTPPPPPPSRWPQVEPITRMAVRGSTPQDTTTGAGMHACCGALTAVMRCGL